MRQDRNNSSPCGNVDLASKFVLRTAIAIAVLLHVLYSGSVHARENILLIVATTWVGTTWPVMAVNCSTRLIWIGWHGKGRVSPGPTPRRRSALPPVQA